MTTQEWINKLLKEKQSLKPYLLSKLEAEDYHGVQDAASDMRDIQSQIEILKVFVNEHNEGDRA